MQTKVFCPFNEAIDIINYTRMIMYFISDGCKESKSNNMHVGGASFKISMHASETVLAPSQEHMKGKERSIPIHTNI